MASVFGRELYQLSHIRSQCDGMSDTQIFDTACDSGMTASVWQHDFSRRNFDSVQDSNAEAWGLIMNSLEAVQAEIEHILRERFMIPEFIPLNTSIPEGATSFSYRVIKQFGKGKFINKDGSNVEKASGSIDKMVFNIEYAGIQPEWSLQELRECLFTGISLSTVSLEAGVDGALAHIQDVGFLGDEELGFGGLLNNSDVPLFAGTVPDFNTATAIEMRAFVNGLVNSIGETSKELVFQHFANADFHIVLPTSAYNQLSDVFHGDTGRTVMEWLAINNAWSNRTGGKIVFKSMHRCTDIENAGGTVKGRVIAYPFSDRILEMAIPIMPRVIKTDDSEGFRIKAPMEYSMGGCNIKRGSLMLYADGVGGAVT